MKSAARQSLRAPTRGSIGAEHTSAPSRRCAFLQEAAQKVSEQLPELAAELMSSAQCVARESNLPRGVFKVRRRPFHQSALLLFFWTSADQRPVFPLRRRVFHVVLRVGTPRREHARRRQRASCANTYRRYVCFFPFCAPHSTESLCFSETPKRWWWLALNKGNHPQEGGHISADSTHSEWC
jgi:hypothetical protein